MHRNHSLIARQAIVAGLGLALACGPVLGYPLVARAATPEASITINQQHNDGATYAAYQLFEADVSANDEASHVAWASPEMEALVLGFLDGNGYADWLATNHPGSGQRERPQNALEFIAHEVEESPEDSAAATTPRTTVGGSFANELAQRLAASDVPIRQATAGTPFTGTEGYWLFVTAATSADGADEAATAPIWVALGGSVTTINEKSALPTVSKQVREDSAEGAAAWGRTADANIGQEVSYRITGTLPANFASFKSFHYRFEDTLSDGLDLVTGEGGTPAGALTVTVNGKPATSGFEATMEGRVLAVDFADLASAQWDDFGLRGGAEVVVEYQARLNRSARLGAAGNDNTVGLVYTNDPIRLSDGRITPPPSPRLFAYELRLLKVDEQTGEPLKGATFTVRVAEGNSDAASAGRYVQADGSLAAAAHEFATDADGVIAIPGIDEGTYVIAETKAPDGYDRIDSDVTVTLTSTTDDATIALTGLQAEVSGGDTAEAGNAYRTELVSIDSTTGVVSIRVTDDRNLALPITGMAGTGGLAGATVALGTGLALWVRRRRTS